MQIVINNKFILTIDIDLWAAFLYTDNINYKCIVANDNIFVNNNFSKGWDDE